MTITRDMLASAARARKTLGPEAADRVGEFVGSRERPDGGFAGRGEESDLYYTSFALLCLSALQHAPGPATREYVAGLGEGRGLDLVDLGCLARCRRLLGIAPDAADMAIARRVGAFAREDGGYHTEAAGTCSTAYGCFIALGALEDLDATPADPAPMTAVLRRMQTPGGGVGNTPGSPLATTPATAAAIVSLRQLGAPAPEGAIQWLRARFGADGGFRAAAGLPAPDLLATAVALHALGQAGEDLGEFRDRGLDYLGSLWDPAGGFHAHWADKELDVEYAFYGLLAAGTLA